MLTELFCAGMSIAASMAEANEREITYQQSINKETVEKDCFPKKEKPLPCAKKPRDHWREAQLKAKENKQAMSFSNVDPFTKWMTENADIFECLQNSGTYQLDIPENMADKVAKFLTSKMESVEDAFMDEGKLQVIVR